MLNIFFPELHPLYTFIALFKKKIAPRTSMISVFLFRKKNYSKIKVYCKQNRHFYQDFFEGFQIFLTSSLYRSMWTIGRSQRVEGKKDRPIVHKIRYLVFVGELKKNVTRQTLASSISFWRVLVSVHSPFWRVLKKMVSQTDTLIECCIVK